MTRRLQWGLLGGGIAAILVYEFLAIGFHFTTITQLVQHASAASPLATFLFGCLTGGLVIHFFTGRR